ncbi:MAG: hypothetical protein ACLFUF_08230, partial [Opitutales bacterium]
MGNRNFPFELKFVLAGALVSCHAFKLPKHNLSLKTWVAILWKTEIKFLRVFLTTTYNQVGSIAKAQALFIGGRASRPAAYAC